nr:uncharacterized protein LOC128691580 [Cherax quadricarinatus]
MIGSVEMPSHKWMFLILFFSMLPTACLSQNDVKAIKNSNVYSAAGNISQNNTHNHDHRFRGSSEASSEEDISVSIFKAENASGQSVVEAQNAVNQSVTHVLNVTNESALERGQIVLQAVNEENQSAPRALNIAQESDPLYKSLADTQTPTDSYNDTTDFVIGVNGWNFMGMWSKFDLALLEETQRPVPLVPDAPDQGVFICQTTRLRGLLEKEFPSLMNASFLLTYYVASANRDLSMIGELMGAENQKVRLFNYSFPDDLTEHNDTWVTQTFKLHNFTRDAKFRIRLLVESATVGVWAASMLQVWGILPRTPIPVLLTTQAPENLTTQITANTTTADLHNTTAENPLFNATTVVTNESDNGTTIAGSLGANKTITVKPSVDKVAGKSLALI